jgi:hypothetical protein
LEKEKNTMREDTKLKPNEGDEVEMVQLTKIELRRSSSEAPARRKGSNRGNSLEAPPWFLGGREREIELDKNGSGREQPGVWLGWDTWSDVWGPQGDMVIKFCTGDTDHWVIRGLGPGH